MNALRLILGACMVLALSGVSVADNKTKPPAKDEKKVDNKEFKEKIVGAWEVEEDSSYKKGTLITFTKGGRSNFKPKGEKKGVDGTYKLDGDKLILTISNISTPPWTIDKITDDELLMKDVAGGTVKWRKK